MSTLAIPGVADGRTLQMLTVRATELRGGDIMGGSAWRRVVSVTVYNDEDHTSVNVITQYLDGVWPSGYNDMVGDLLVPILRPEPLVTAWNGEGCVPVGSGVTA